MKNTKMEKYFEPLDYCMQAFKWFNYENQIWDNLLTIRILRFIVHKSRKKAQTVASEDAALKKSDIIFPLKLSLYLFQFIMYCEQWT